MRIRLACLIAVTCATQAMAQGEIAVSYLRQQVVHPPVLSNLDPIPQDLGIAGARLGLAENQTTGKFLGQSYSLEVTDVAPGGDLLTAARAALAASPLLLLDAPAADILAVADLPEAREALIFDVASADTALRSADCRRNVLHTLPSNAMRADALTQFLVTRRWSDLVMVTGEHPEDLAFADALRASAKKFGLKIRREQMFAFDADMRRNAGQEMPVLTQGLKDYDVLLIADEVHDFGRYVMFNTWLPRPVAGSEGLVPVAWSPVMEQWGATQLQNRFHDLAARPMEPVDYSAWAALRSIGEAASRTGQTGVEPLRAYMLSDKFELGGFKGKPLSYRAWNGQLRQPVALVQPRALVALAPLEGFLHQRTELDTLGLDQPDSACTAFTE